MNEHAVGDVVRDAREARSWTQLELADATGLHKLQVHRIETGERKKLSTAEIGALCRALDLAVEDLLGIRRAQPVVTAAAARLMCNDVPVEHSKTTSRAADLLAISGVWADATVKEQVRKWWTVPTRGLEKSKGYELARQVRESLELGDEPIDDVQLLCEREFGLSVALEPLPDNLRGLLVRVQDAEPDEASEPDVAMEGPVQGFALVDTERQTPSAQRFTMAHELGHYLFEDFDDGMLQVEQVSSRGGRSPRLVETRSECFAAELLAPARAIAKMAAEHMSTSVQADVAFAVQVSKTFGVSWEAARNRVCDVAAGSVRAPELKQWRRSQAKALVGDWGEPDEGSGAGEVLPPPLYLRDALTAYADGRLSVLELARVFRTDDAIALRRELEAAGWVPHADASPTVNVDVSVS